MSLLPSAGEVTTACPFSPAREKVAEGRMRGGAACRQLLNPTRQRRRHIVSGNDKRFANSRYAPGTPWGN